MDDDTQGELDVDMTERGKRRDATSCKQPLDVFAMVMELVDVKPDGVHVSCLEAPMATDGAWTTTGVPAADCRRSWRELLSESSAATVTLESELRTLRLSRNTVLREGDSTTSPFGEPMLTPSSDERTSPNEPRDSRGDTATALPLEARSVRAPAVPAAAPEVMVRSLDERSVLAHVRSTPEAGQIDRLPAALDTTLLVGEVVKATSEQSVPVKPASHVHTPVASEHEPCAEHRFGQGTGHAQMS